MSEGRILREVHEGVCTLTIDRPDKKNALTLAMYEQLVEGFRAASVDDEARVLVIRGHETVFTAGNDLGDFMKHPPTGPESPVFQLLLELAGLEMPLIAAVTGPAIGLGTTMLLHCDFVYAGEGARFHMPFVDLGLCPEGGSSYLLPRIAGLRRASKLLLLGEPFDAYEAKECGFVTEIVADEDVFTHAEQIARRLARKPPTSVLITKQLLKEATREPLKQTLHEEASIFMQRLVSPEARQAFAAFFARKG
jgi:enoyl-CoA hydratase/carnithine racemase